MINSTELALNLHFHELSEGGRHCDKTDSAANQFGAHVTKRGKKRGTSPLFAARVCPPCTSLEVLK